MSLEMTLLVRCTKCGEFLDAVWRKVREDLEPTIWVYPHDCEDKKES